MRKPDVPYKDAAQHQSGAIKSVIDQWASDVAVALEFKPGASISAIINSLGGRLHYGDSPESPNGGTIYIHGEGDFDILLPEWTSPRRDRFTIAHELGHYCLHSQFGKIPLVATRSGSGRSEWEANWFAAGFLIPKLDFCEKVAQGISPAALATIYKVSGTAIQIRMNSLGVSAKK